MFTISCTLTIGLPMRVRVSTRGIWCVFCMIIIQAFLLLQFSSTNHIVCDIHDHDHEHEKSVCAYFLANANEDAVDNINIDYDDFDLGLDQYQQSTQSLSRISLSALKTFKSYFPELFVARLVRAPPFA